MPKREIEKGEAELKSKKLKKEKSIDEAKTEIVIALTDKLNELLEDTENQDSIDGIIDSIKEIFQSIFDEFKAQIGENEDKRSFIGGLIRIFAILLSVKASVPTKILKNNKRKHKFSNKIMARAKATVRRINAPSFVAAPGQRIGNKNILNRRNVRFKIKTILPQQKPIEVKKKWPSGTQNDCEEGSSLF